MTLKSRSLDLHIETATLLHAGLGHHPNDVAMVSTASSWSWLDTGDMMEADSDGYLRFRGRKKQIIVHDGSNISPHEVEEALLEHAAVENAAVIGIHDLMHGENVRAYVTHQRRCRPTTHKDGIDSLRP